MKLDAMKKEIERLEKQAKVASGWKKESEWSYKIELPEKEIYGIKVKPCGAVLNSSTKWTARVYLEILQGLGDKFYATSPSLSGSYFTRTPFGIRLKTSSDGEYSFHDTLEEAKKAVEDVLDSVK